MEKNQRFVVNAARKALSPHFDTVTEEPCQAVATGANSDCIRTGNHPFRSGDGKLCKPGVVHREVGKKLIKGTSFDNIVAKGGA